MLASIHSSLLTCIDGMCTALHSIISTRYEGVDYHDKTSIPTDDQEPQDTQQYHSQFQLEYKTIKVYIVFRNQKNIEKIIFVVLKYNSLLSSLSTCRGFIRRPLT